MKRAISISISVFDRKNAKKVFKTVAKEIFNALSRRKDSNEVLSGGAITCKKRTVATYSIDR